MSEVVSTESGAVRGVSAAGVTAFRGVPYAGPLLGPRRFQAPTPAPRWDGVREAREFGAWVPQPAHPAIPMPVADPDCLTVNVWTPQTGGGDLPVMVWLHGGGFYAGSAASPAFDGTSFAQAGVVFVSVNYRVGYEGFGWVADAPCNRGVLDQLAALRWVRDNIFRFGGDPDRVTVFGHSAGATSLIALVAGRGTEGLFQRAIAQSPGGLFVPHDEGRTVSAMITDELGVPQTAEALASLPAEAIHAAQWTPVTRMQEDPSAWSHPHSPYAVILDGALLDERPWEAMRSTGSGRAIDLICGATRDEANIWTAALDRSEANPVQDAHNYGLDAAAVQDYRDDRPDISDGDVSSALATDGMFRLPSRWSARAHAESGGRTFLYEFAWSASPLGAYHGLEVPFVFGIPTPGGPLLDEPFPAGPDEFEVLSTAMRRAWISFAVTGDPGWPRYQADDWSARIWDTPPSLASDPTTTSAEIWDRRHRGGHPA
ncbi:carboxylesterase family protein [Saccharopolyspora sp. TS4A08]|uniref:Carboxylic ester hydrolase n=1 Tax=Saccharopolyspora ipomoeae TaxID=3042027 RepID=A0ABT6PWA2_9PSEU|nr:carboxylesterase family protein [Saccharopolyspora sp. TS4A08]MDI2032296.1 carboxylesterase family protein [Saccharopolyspora sp. TS4A08]